MNRCWPALLLLGAAVSGTMGAWAQDSDPWWQPDAVAGYVGAGTTEKLKEALLFKYDSSEETLFAVEADWRLDDENPLNRAAGWLGATIEPVALIAHRDDRQQDIGITEAALFANLRWQGLLFNDSLHASAALGWGVSYTTDITADEAQDEEDADEDEGPQRWLNYLGVEFALSLPRHPQWQVFYRLHHRSGAFSLFAANDVGSNVMGLGIRYHFDR